MGTKPGSIIWLLLLSLFLATGCSARGLDGSRGSDSAPESAPDAAPGGFAGSRPAAAPQLAPAPAARSASAPAPAPAAAQSSAAQVDFSQRLIVRTANLRLLVDEVGPAALQVGELTESVGGILVNSTQREENGRPAATVTIRVPAERFEEVMDRLRGLAVRVSSEQVNSQDVTEEFVDVDARLRNLRATEERYLALLQQARTVEDILKVEQQLSNVRGQIEQLQGRLEYLRRSAQTSLITVELRPLIAAQPPVGGWSALPVIAQAWAALVAAIQFLLAVLIWLVVFSPLWIPALLLIRHWRRRRRAARAGRERVSAAAPATSAGAG
jgi:hypothetical protein